ncbi:hypothetical protein CIHG_06028 [Coccidioides immitis H538.4]|uniref:Uncharacterized protein n=3 Tax=Coccidioides immitis TaxID=5501 RepID=A0A0J8QU21_COCIT|nr:hypothetical protein CIRG_01779 [Coccidioides immitis RMSCC 2394]KMU76384.1 hypothetical protein CISG_01118 [Coccidioides immitis RMSCC 3703]KMU87635.1 hypothetical protein CIHG_06028 [Coccidioides immitis H538.4]
MSAAMYYIIEFTMHQKPRLNPLNIRGKRKATLGRMLQDYLTDCNTDGYVSEFGLETFFQFPFHLPSTAARNPWSSTTIRMQRRTHLDPRRESYGERDALRTIAFQERLGWTLN